MKVKTDYVPASCDYLTKGKEYEVTGDFINGGYIYADDGNKVFINIPTSSHLNGKDWEIVEEA